jgi:hypothetical protein
MAIFTHRPPDIGEEQFAYDRCRAWFFRQPDIWKKGLVGTLRDMLNFPDVSEAEKRAITRLQEEVKGYEAICANDS